MTSAINLPQHVLDEIERRWAARLGRDVVEWRKKRMRCANVRASPLRRIAADIPAAGTRGFPRRLSRFSPPL